MKMAGRVLTTAMAVTALLSFGSISTANAALQAVGPISPVYAIPSWIQDTQGLSLQICVDQTTNPSLCILPPPFDTGTPITATGPVNAGNFPDESFYWIADSVPMNVGPTLADGFSLRMALEVAYLGAITPGSATVFLRVNVNKVSGLTPGATYTVTYPYGSFQFTADGAGDSPTPQLFRSEDFCIGNCDTGTIPTAAAPLIAATETNIGPFLIWDPNVAPAAPAGFIGDPAVAHRLINPAAPLTPVVVRIDGPNIGGLGVDTIQTDLFTLAGKKIGLSATRVPATGPVTTQAGTPANIPVTVTNVTGAGITFGATPFSVTGPHATDFTIVAGDTCTGQTIAANATCAFTVRYSPVVGTILPLHDATVTLTPTTNTIPPLVMPVSGVPQYQITRSATAGGTVTPTVNQIATAGSNVEFTITPANTSTFARVLVDGNKVTPTANKFTFTGLNNHHTIDVKFLKAGDVNEDGTITTSDALRALQIALGVGVTATVDEGVAADVGPLVASKPKADGAVDVSDVMLILRRSIGLTDPQW
jgi:hypothetical protein